MGVVLSGYICDSWLPAIAKLLFKKCIIYHSYTYLYTHTHIHTQTLRKILILFYCVTFDKY